MSKKGAANPRSTAADAPEGLSSIQKTVLESLLREYEIAMMLDLQDDSYEIFKMAGRFAKYLSGILRKKFSSTMLEIADSCIYSYDYDLFISAVSLDSLRNRLETESYYSFVFRADRKSTRLNSSHSV